MIPFKKPSVTYYDYIMLEYLGPRLSSKYVQNLESIELSDRT